MFNFYNKNLIREGIFVIDYRRVKYNIIIVEILDERLKLEIDWWGGMRIVSF